jgi:hypothetical protein
MKSSAEPITSFTFRGAIRLETPVHRLLDVELSVGG